MTLPKEWQQMVLAQTIEFNVLYDDHVVVTHAEHCSIKKFVRVLPIATRQISERLLNSFWCPAQPFAIRIFTDQGEHLAHQVRNRFLSLGISNHDFSGFAHFISAFHTDCSPVYSKLFLLVSSIRSRSTRAAEQ